MSAEPVRRPAPAGPRRPWARRLPTSRRLRTTGVLLAGAALLAASAVAAYAAMFSNYSPHDDEGYLMLSLREFLAGGRLYDEVYTQYGPLHYQLQGAVFAATGHAVTHDAGRLLTIGVWLVTAVALGATAYRLTGSVYAGMVSYLLAFHVLFSLRGEPLHPGGPLLLMLVLVVALAAAVVPRRPTAGLAAVGVLAGAALLVKVNIGVVILVAVAFAWVFAAPELRAARAVRIAAAAAFVAFPVALMARDLVSEGFLRYALQVTLGAAALALVAAAARPPLRRERGTFRAGVAAVVAGAVGVAALSSLLALALGSSAGALLEGAVVAPARHRDVNPGAPGFEPRALELALLGVVAAGFAALRLGLPAASPRAWLAPLLRAGAGLLIWLAVLGPVLLLPIGQAVTLSIALPLAWVAALPSPRDGNGTLLRFGRLLVPSLAVMHSLHAYPVAGAQAAWSGLLFIIVGGVCIADGWAGGRAWLATQPPDERRLAERALLAAAAALGAHVLLTALVFPLQQHVSAFRAAVPLGLPGAERLRVTPEQADTYRWLTGELRERCSTFVSLPGLNSLYFWTGMDPPTRANATTWMFLFDETLQQHVVDRASGIDRLCAVRYPGLSLFWQKDRPLPSRPLVRFIEEEFELVEERGGLELLTRRPS
jgi:hypothetical protein